MSCGLLDERRTFLNGQWRMTVDNATPNAFGATTFRVGRHIKSASITA